MAAAAACCVWPTPSSAGVVAYSSTRCPEQGSACKARIWTVDDDGANMRRLDLDAARPDSWLEFPSWSPDGSGLLYRERSAYQEGSPTTYGLRIARPDGLVPPRQVGGRVPSSQHFDYERPSWSPDGASILFTSRPADYMSAPKGAPYDLYLMTLDGTVKRLTAGPPHYYDAVFAPSGRRILAATFSAKGAPRVVSLNLQGGDERPVYITTDRVDPVTRVATSLQFAPSPDGRDMALNVAGGVSTLSSDTGVLQRRSETLFWPFSGQLAYSDEPNPTLIVERPFGTRPKGLATLDLSGSSATLNALTPEETTSERDYGFYGDGQPDWRPTVPRIPPLDRTPPNAGWVLPPLGGSSARPRRVRYRAVRRGQIRYSAFDLNGVAKVAALITRVGASRSRPRYRALTGQRSLRRRLKRLRRGRYVLRLRARDTSGRRSRPRVLRVRLR